MSLSPDLNIYGRVQIMLLEGLFNFEESSVYIVINTHSAVCTAKSSSEISVNCI